MADKPTPKFIEVPTTLEDPVVLDRFINELVEKLNNNVAVRFPIMYGDYTGTIPPSEIAQQAAYTSTILEAATRFDSLSGDTKNYITENLETIVLQNSSDVSTVTEQFGTFYDDATAAAWYGLTVKTGELISGFTIGGVDTDTTTPGTAGSFFGISADSFSVGRAIEDITDPAELAYVNANGLPYGTMYDAVEGKIIPAFLIEWNGSTYDIFFNGNVTFSNVTDTGSIVQANDDITRLTNNAGYTDDTVANGKNTVFYQATPPIALAIGDLWFDTDDNYHQYTWSGAAWVDATMDAALAVNSNTTTINGSKLTTGSVTATQVATKTLTAYHIAAGTITVDEIAANTLTAAVIAANTLTANEIASNTITALEIAANTITSNEMSTNVLLVGGKIESSNYDWNAGAPIGFGLYAAGDTVSGQAYNIIGGKIFGGAVEGTSLKGVTLDIQDINIKDTAGTTVAASFQGTGAFTYDSGTYTLTMTTGIMTSGNAPFNLLANNGYLSLSHNVLHSLVAPIQAGYTWLCSTDSSSLAVRVYYGTGSTYRSLTLNSLTADETVYGWTFKVVKDLTYSKDYHYYIKNNNVPEDSVTDTDGFVITLDSTGVMDTPMGTNTSVPFQWLVSNI